MLERKPMTKEEFEQKYMKYAKKYYFSSFVPDEHIMKTEEYKEVMDPLDSCNLKDVENGVEMIESVFGFGRRRGENLSEEDEKLVWDMEVARSVIIHDYLTTVATKCKCEVK